MWRRGLQKHMSIFTFMLICSLSFVNCETTRSISCSNIENPVLYAKTLEDEPTLIDLETGSSKIESLPFGQLRQEHQQQGQQQIIKDLYSWQADMWIIIGVETDADKYLEIHDTKNQKNVTISRAWSKYDDFFIFNQELIYFESRQLQKLYSIDVEYGILMPYGISTKFNFSRAYPSIAKLDGTLCVFGGNDINRTPTECHHKQERKWQINDKLPQIVGKQLQIIVYQSILYVCTRLSCAMYSTIGENAGNNFQSAVTAYRSVGSNYIQKLFIMNKTVYALTISTGGSLEKTDLKTKIKTALTESNFVNDIFVLINHCGLDDKPGCTFTTKSDLEYSLNGVNTLRHFPDPHTWRLEPNDFVTFRCQSHSVMQDCKNKKREIKCQKNKAQDYQAESDDHDDSSNQCYPAKKCPVPKHLDNIVLPSIVDVGVGVKLQLKCKPGYYVRLGDQKSDQNSTCTCTGSEANVEWEPLFWECNKARCGAVHLDNGHLKYANGESYVEKTSLTTGKFLSVTCDSGFTAETNKIFCELVDNKPSWSSLPHCNKVTCNPEDLNWDSDSGKLMQQLGNGSVVKYDNTPLEYGNELIMGCNKGFSTNDAVVGCLLDHDGLSAAWYPEPVCKRIPCRIPNHPTNGRLLHSDKTPINKSTINFGESLIVDCNSGYGAVDLALRCIVGDHSDTVKWNRESECQALTCSGLKSIQNGTMKYKNNSEYLLNDVSPGTVILVTCDNAFLIDNSTVECVIDKPGNTAHWNQVPNCRSLAFKSANFKIIVPAAVCGFVVILALLVIVSWYCGCCHRNRRDMFGKSLPSTPGFGDSSTRFVRSEMSTSTMGTFVLQETPTEPIYETIPPMYEYDYPSYIPDTYLEPRSSSSSSSATHHYINNESYFFPIPR